MGEWGEGIVCHGLAHLQVEQQVPAGPEAVQPLLQPRQIKVRAGKGEVAAEAELEQLGQLGGAPVLYGVQSGVQGRQVGGIGSAEAEGR